MIISGSDKKVNMEDENKNKSLGGNIAGKFMGESMGDAANIASDLREGKAGAVAMKAAEMGVNAALSATGVGGVVVKAAKFIGIPVDKIIVYLILAVVLLLFLPTVLAAGYAFTHPGEVLWELFKFKVGAN